MKAWEDIRHGFPVTTVDILDGAGADSLGKPQGRYVTITVDGLLHREEGAFHRGTQVVAQEVSTMLREIGDNSTALVVGLGNRAITPDAIGPRVHDATLVTRHLVAQMPAHFGALRPVLSLSPGVLGTTGADSGEIVAALVDKLSPACVIAVDALAARSVHRLCRTVQISNTGITPGSGVGNHRHGLNEETLGVPVIAVGVPTVVDGRTLAADLLGSDTLPQLGQGADLFVTPKDIDSQVSDLSKLLAYGINLGLQPTLTVEDLDLLLG